MTIRTKVKDVTLSLEYEMIKLYYISKGVLIDLDSVWDNSEFKVQKKRRIVRGPSGARVAKELKSAFCSFVWRGRDSWRFCVRANTFHSVSLVFRV